MSIEHFFQGIGDSIRSAGDGDWATTNGWMVPLSMITAGAGSAIFGGGAAAGGGESDQRRLPDRSGRPRAGPGVAPVARRRSVADRRSSVG